jgi:hypothetical protein
MIEQKNCNFNLNFLFKKKNENYERFLIK